MLNFKITFFNHQHSNKKRNALSFAKLFLGILFFCSFIQVGFSQENTSDPIVKSSKVEVVAGVKYILHTVEKGQTLFAISKAYGLKLSDVVLENPQAIDGIHPLDVLKIPTEKPKEIALTPIEEPEVEDENLHEVLKGQTLYSLSKYFNISIEKLVELNPILQEGLKVGQKLIVVNPDTIKQEVKVPVVKKEVLLKDTVKVKNFHRKRIFVVDTLSKLSDTSAIVVDSVVAEDSLKFYPGNIKDKYYIAFLLPFHAEEADTLEIEKLLKGEYHLPHKSTIALQFYEGALMALDSLKKQHLNATVFVYDIDDSDSLYLEKLMKKPDLAEMDLMIGPIYGSDFMPLAKFAKEHNIPIISPFTAVNKILFENPYVCKVLPSSTLQVEQMAHFVVDSFSKQNIILINNGIYRERSFYSSFKNTANGLMPYNGDTTKSKIKEANGFAGLLNHLKNADTSKIDVVILPSNDQAYVTEFINDLNTLHKKHKIVLVGLQDWINYDNLDFEYLNRFKVHMPFNNYIDYKSIQVQHFISEYYTKYRMMPELYAYNGFDVTYFFVSALQKFGSGFLNNIQDHHYKGVAAQLNFIQSATIHDGFENKFIVIMKYDNYELKKAN